MAEQEGNVALSDPNPDQTNLMQNISTNQQPVESPVQESNLPSQ